ncbi:hypothetical protein JG688_00000501 [Phytophthora aleatoria]|uniref:Inositol polyphosphate-related phosphatase domain-containing protein n=1 Tax=Phytophthora aleatoria TaxID=2496075 RepID=A0A8J5J4Y6_9STRA|nr:hypothetical protein JG688_00000501 [Phytophthora aleatoria]
MSERHDAGPNASLSDAQEARLQIVGYLSSALSLSGTLYVLAHFGYAHWCKPRRLETFTPQQLPFQRRQRNRMDFMDKLVLVLALFDLVTIATRAVGRGVVHNFALCRAQAAITQAGNLASCVWICCMAFNLYRWIAGGESDATRQRRFPLFLAFALVPGAGFVVFHLMTNKYGDATFYCWLDEIRYMFLNFYLFYLLMIVFNFVLLALIHFNMKQRVARHDTVEADTSSMLIRRKLLLYILVFIAHRTPMMIYRIFEAGGMDSLSVGLAMQVIQDLNGFSNSIVYGGICRRRTKEVPPPRECEAESVSSPTESIMGGYVVKKRPAVAEDEHDSMSDSGESSVDKGIHGRKVQDDHSYNYRTWHQRLQKRFSLHHPPPLAPVEPKKIAIFASTFNMGEKDVNESELREWIPLGQDVYVIGVQECMDLADLQIKILRHLVSGSTSKYVHYSREIGKRATALGYHGYIALCIFVRATAVASGRFRMPHRQSSNKNAQEVFRGKSLLLFGRASNKGAVGMSFRFDNTSFAFVTCHLASDSSSLKRAKRKKSSNAVLLQAQKASDSSMELNYSGNAQSSGGDSGGSKTSVSDGMTMETHQPPSKVERRNQDAMEILQQLYLDEEDYGFGFPHLHHHSFILGDFNYLTSSDHKPVSACFEVELLALPQKTSPASLLAEDSMWNANSTDANPMILRADRTLSSARMKDVPGACELRLRMEFRSIHWIDAVDSALFDRAEHVEFGFLFPLPCEDVFAHQRKLHEVAEHLTFGGTDSGNSGGMGFASTITPTSNFHTLKWHEFVNGGLRYHTMAGTLGRKHVAVVLRSLGRVRTLSKTSSASRLLGGSCSLSPHTSNNSIASTCSPTPHNSSVGSSSSFSSEKFFGHGTFCAEGMAKKRDVCVPLTLGGRLLGRLQLRVSLQMRQKK